MVGWKGNNQSAEPVRFQARRAREQRGVGWGVGVGERQGSSLGDGVTKSICDESNAGGIVFEQTQKPVDLPPAILNIHHAESTKNQREPIWRMHLAESAKAGSIWAESAKAGSPRGNKTKIQAYIEGALLGEFALLAFLDDYDNHLFFRISVVKQKRNGEQKH